TFAAFAAKSLKELTDQSRVNASEFAAQLTRQLDGHVGNINSIRSALEEKMREMDGHVRALEAKRERAYADLEKAYEAFTSQSVDKLTQQSRADANEFSGKIGSQLDSHKANIGELGTSLQKSIDKMDDQVRELERERVGAYSGLKETVSDLKLRCDELLA